jgi:CheY-like chemotaxis protein
MSTDNDGSRVILLVEDDDDVRQSMVELLEGEGHRVVAVDGGRAALTLLESTRPWLILLDLMMPQMGGEEFLTHYRAAHGNDLPRIILLTAAKAEARIATELGVERVVRKPFKIAELLAAIAAHE